MVKIRLTRRGVRRKTFYRIVAIDDGQKARGVALEVLGWWHPAKKAKSIKKDRVKFWLGKGAKPTRAVSSLLKD